MPKRKEIKNVGASVRARLTTLSRTSGQPFDLLLTRFAIERLLYRLAVSPHAQRFVLKGAVLLMTWLPDPHRATRDLDLLGFGDPTPEAILQVFRDVLAVHAEDGVKFDPNNLRIELIREQLDYSGLRLSGSATIGGAVVRLLVDIGFGDALEPGVTNIDYPVLLDFPVPRLKAYAPETVIAEKFQAMVALGRINSRMKDFYDIWVLARIFPFADDRLPRAIAATFARRNTAIPAEPPDALTPAFAADQSKQVQGRRHRSWPARSRHRRSRNLSYATRNGRGRARSSICRRNMTTAHGLRLSCKAEIVQPALTRQRRA